MGGPCSSPFIRIGGPPPDAVPSFWIGPADTWFMAMSEDVCMILHLFLIEKSCFFNKKSI